ncbi:MAG TPA: hypothetical protein PLW66_04790, partial [Saprospiraceae bacterium]|nr:hypothetical protein [Saprospiraceae bacterium]
MIHDAAMWRQLPSPFPGATYIRPRWGPGHEFKIWIGFIWPAEDCPDRFVDWPVVGIVGAMLFNFRPAYFRYFVPVSALFLIDFILAQVCFSKINASPLDP